MIAGERLFSMLSSDEGVTALVATRIFPQVLQAEDPDGIPVLPAIAYHVITDRAEKSLDARSTSLRHRHVQVDCYALAYLEAQVIADAVESVLTAYTAPGMTSRQSTRRDLYENDAKWFRVVLDFSWWTTD